MKTSLFCLVSLFTSFVSAQTPRILTLIDSNQKEIQWSASDLLRSPHIEDITIEARFEAAHKGQTMKYKAIKIAQLFEKLQVNPTDLLSFEASDGFSAPLLKKSSDIALGRLTNKYKTIAYLAIEEEEKPWPDLSEFHGTKHKGTAGPFYIIWVNGEKEGIGHEEWAFKVTKLKLVQGIESQHPKLVPKTNAPTHVKEGMLLFVKNCFVCHSFNQEGLDKKGPDLNFPESPLDYFGKKRLLRFVRNPQQIRQWNNGQMPAFTKENLSDDDLQKIIAYFKHMAKKN